MLQLCGSGPVVVGSRPRDSVKRSGGRRPGSHQRRVLTGERSCPLVFAIRAKAKFKRSIARKLNPEVTVSECSEQHDKRPDSTRALRPARGSYGPREMAAPSSSFEGVDSIDVATYRGQHGRLINATP